MRPSCGDSRPRRFLTDVVLDYVLQRALSVAEGEQKELLINKIRPQLTSMRRYSSAYSKHLISSEFDFIPFFCAVNG